MPTPSKIILTTNNPVRKLSVSGGRQILKALYPYPDAKEIMVSTGIHTALNQAAETQSQNFAELLMNS
jgi:hypothetical protein